MTSWRLCGSKSPTTGLQRRICKEEAMPLSRNPNLAASQTRVFAFAFACLVGALATVAPARAEVSEVRIVRQFGIHYLPLVIMEHEKLIEKAAAADGQKDL